MPTETTKRDAAVKKARARRQRQIDTLDAGIRRRKNKIETEYRAAVEAAYEAHLIATDSGFIPSNRAKHDNTTKGDRDDMLDAAGV